MMLQLCEQPGEEDEIDGSIAHDLIRDMDIAALRVPDPGDLHLS